MSKRPWRSKRFDFTGPHSSPGKKPGKPYNISRFIEASVPSALKRSKGNWIKATDFLFKKMQLEVLRGMNASNEQKSQAVSALSLERHMVKAARLTIAGRECSSGKQPSFSRTVLN